MINKSLVCVCVRVRVRVCVCVTEHLQCGNPYLDEVASIHGTPFPSQTPIPCVHIIFRYIPVTHSVHSYVSSKPCDDIKLPIHYIHVCIDLMWTAVMSYFHRYCREDIRPAFFCITLKPCNYAVRIHGCQLKP